MPHNDGRQPILKGHFSESSDLKKLRKETEPTLNYFCLFRNVIRKHKFLKFLKCKKDIPLIKIKKLK